MRENARNKTRRITISALLTALGVILLWFGSLIEVLDISIAVIAAMLVTYAVIELRGAYPFMIWIGTSFLGFLLLPVKSPVIFYALFAGVYPILKEKFERKLPLLLCRIAKIVFFHLSLFLIVLLFRLFLPGEIQVEKRIYLLFLYLLALVCFFLFDFCLSKLILVYFSRLQKHFKVR